MTSAADLFHALPASGKFALLLSVSVHAAIVVMAARGAPHAAAKTSRTADALLELTTVEAPLGETPLPRAPEPASARASHHHDYPVPPSHDAAPHDPAIHHVLPVPSAASLPATGAPSVLEAPISPAPHFSLVVSSALRAPGALSTAGVVASKSHADAAAEPASEASVDTPATVLANTPPSFTEEAQAAGIEADVPLEIVVDTQGSVISARALSHVGYGLEDAALRSVRSSRFSPARRTGKAVAVRMRWLIRFQLR